MNVHALGTHTDWVYNGGAWGRPGHQRIADLTYAAGVRRLYWRTHNGGQAKYPSKVCKVEDGKVFRDPNFKGLGTLPKSYFAYAQYLDYREWDQVADMSEIGSAVGLEVCHWYTVFEDDHGGHLTSDFSLDHPQYHCTLKNGETLPGCLDFWYPEVRAYKLAIIDELLEKPTSRLLLDFLRRNGKPSADAVGHFRYGYNVEIVEGFRQETGLDARTITPATLEWDGWLAYNARPLTEFLREVKRRTEARGIPLDLLTWSVDTYRWQALDLSTLAREGIMENVLTGTQRYASSGADARRQVASMQDVLAESSVSVLPGLFTYHQITPDTVDDFFKAADSLRCPAVVLHEANHIIESQISDRLRAWFYGKPHGQREVVATVVGQSVKVARGFIKAHDIENESCDQNTEFSISYSATELVISVTAQERNPAALLPVPGLGKDNYNANELKARAFWSPYESLHVFLDALHQHEDYFHFVLDPSGEQQEERRLDEDWTGPWSGAVKINAADWGATFSIPWSTLGILPERGLRLGFQIVRIQNSPREVSAWFCATARRMSPLDFGHLRLA